MNDLLDDFDFSIFEGKNLEEILDIISEKGCSKTDFKIIRTLIHIGLIPASSLDYASIKVRFSRYVNSKTF